jgi:hypothetical protein
MKSARAGFPARAPKHLKMTGIRYIMPSVFGSQVERIGT